jgi:DNA replication protein DnaC
MGVERTESTASCELHGSYPATISTMTVGNKTHTSMSLCPTCNEEPRRIQERRRRGFDQAQDAVICERHGEYTATTKTYFGSDNVPSRPFISLCPGCEREREEQREERRRKQEQERREEQRRARIERNRKIAAIPTRFAFCTFDNYDANLEGQRHSLTEAKRFAENFDAVTEKGSSLILCGRPGCGKTHLVSAIGNHLIAAGRTVIYTQVIELARAIRDTWRHDSEKTTTVVIEKYRTVDLLILDEAGVQFRTEAERTQLFDILDGRYR